MCNICKYRQIYGGQKMKTSDQLTRRQVGQLLGKHPDSITRSLRDGLGSAVVAWGGSSRTMIFSKMLVQRWHNAKTCLQGNGRPCLDCRCVLEDAEVTAGHLIDERHGVFENCGPEICGHGGGFCQPCRWIPELWDYNSAKKRARNASARAAC